MGELKFWVKHCQEDSAEGKPSRMCLHYSANDLDHLAQAFHRVVLALDRHDHFGAAGQSGLGHFAKGGGRVDEDGVEGGAIEVEMLA